MFLTQVWDGFGGQCKQKLNRDTIDGLVSLLSAKDVLDRLRLVYGESSGWSGDVIKSCKFFDLRSTCTEILQKRPKLNPKFHKVKHIRSHYEYVAISKGFLLMREWGCWCGACMLVEAGTTETSTSSTCSLGDDMRSVRGCSRPSSKFESVSCDPKSGSMAAQIARESRERSLLLASQLKVGDIFAIEMRDPTEKDDDFSYILGYAVDALETKFVEAEEGISSGCIIKTFSGRVQCNGTRHLVFGE